MPTTTYSAMIRQVIITSENNDIQLGAGNSQYDSVAGIAREVLITRGWTIADGGPELSEL